MAKKIDFPIIRYAVKLDEKSDSLNDSKILQNLLNINKKNLKLLFVNIANLFCAFYN